MKNKVLSMREMKLLLEHMSRLLEEADIRDARNQEQVRLANERADRNEERADRLAEQVSELVNTLKAAHLTIAELKDTIHNLSNQLSADRSVR